RRLLRKTGLDRDLIEIIDRALATEPADRYPHAGVLAADLKAFKAGARIASRHYSLLDSLGHWARRHRGAAVSIVVALIAAVAGSALYVRGIAAERDRADASNNNLILEHAQSLMPTNPSAARDLLQTYTGPDAQRLDLLRAEARGRGTSVSLGRPHTRHLMLVRALDDGAVLSVGEDGTVTKTSLAGVTRTIARDVAPVDAAAFSPEHHLLAYACDNAAVCVLDTRGEAPLPGPARDRPLHPLAVALSADASRLAVASTTGELTVWQLGAAPALLLETRSERGDLLRFVDNDTVLHATGSRLHVVKVGGAARTRELDGDIKAIDVRGQVVAIGTSRGQVVVLDPRGEAVQDKACDFVRVVLALDAQRIAYGCTDGRLGVWQADRREIEPLLRAPSRIDSLAVDGSTLYAGTQAGEILGYDFATRLSTTYAAHTNDVLTLQAASPSFPYLTSSDYEDNIRVWAMPAPVARLALQAPGPLTSTAWLPGRHALVAWGHDDEIDWLDRGEVARTTGHAPEHVYIAFNSRTELALFGGNDEVELWSIDAPHAHRSFRTGHGSTYIAAFADDGAALLTGSEDGALTLWSMRDASRIELAKLDAVPYIVRECGTSATLALTDWGGGVWVYEHQRMRFIARVQGSITSTACSPDGATFAVLSSTGEIRLFALATGRETLLAASASPLRFAMFSPDGSQLFAVAGSELRAFRLPGAPAGPRPLPARLELPSEAV
ncbi:MAG TPA: WD40 repeat domain-containing protein, partial [Kofleriaceae bacterium]